MRKRSDAWIGVGLLAFSGVMFVAGLSLPRAPYGTMGPEYFPNIILGMVAVLSLVLAIQGLAAVRSSSDSARGMPLGGLLHQYRNIGYSFGLFFLFALLLPYLGYLLTSFVFLIVLQVLLGPKEWGKAKVYLAVSVGMTLLLFLLFRCMLLVILPESDFDAVRALEGVAQDGVCGCWEAVSRLWN